MISNYNGIAMVNSSQLQNETVIRIWFTITMVITMVNAKQLQLYVIISLLLNGLQLQL